jgi:transposase
MQKTMTKYNSNDIKNAVKLYYSCKSYRKTAEQTGISKSTINTWVNRVGEKVVDKRKGRKIENRKTRIPKEIEDTVRELFTESATFIKKCMPSMGIRCPLQDG